MSGQHNDLVEYSSRGVPEGSERTAFKIMLRAILRNQIVQVEGVPNVSWTVKIGTGMGLGCSGEVSDTAFHFMVEEGVMNNE
eukprot:5774400-Pyramimonas_sp.AAC.1